MPDEFDQYLVADDDFSAYEVKKPVDITPIGRSEKRVQEREGLALMESLSKVAKGNAAQKAIGGLEVIAAPGRAIEAAIANPLLELQRGNIGEKDLAKGFAISGPLGAVVEPILKAQETGYRNMPSSILEALKGKRMGEFGDVFIGAGMSEGAASAAGLAVDIALTGGILEMGLNGMKKQFLNKSDKAALKAVDDLSVGIDKAQEASKAATNMFWREIDDVSVNPDKFSSKIENLPPKAIQIIEENIGKSLSEVSLNPKLSDVREVKQAIGALRPGAFGKVERGLDDTLDDIKINKTYSNVKKLINNTLLENGLEKQAKQLIEVDDAAEEAIKAAKILKGEIKTSKGKAKVTTLLQDVSGLSGAAMREAMDTLSKTSPSAKRVLQKSLLKLRNIAIKESRKRALQSLLKYGVGGAIVGTMTRQGIKSSGILDNQSGN